MFVIRKLYRNLEEHELELNRYKRNGDDKKKWSLTLKASKSFDDWEHELNEIETKDDEDEMNLLSKTL